MYKTMTFQKEPHDCMVKGKAYRPQFLAGAGGFTFEISEYTPCSLSWVLQSEWEILKIKPVYQPDRVVIQHQSPVQMMLF
jgi:hypothetical protein